MKFNGTIVLLEETLTLLDFLILKGFNTGKIAVELNGGIVPKMEYENILLKNDDTLEIVSFVGGG